MDIFLLSLWTNPYSGVITVSFMDLPETVDVNASYACGGNLLQLATLRGNPDNMQYLLDLQLVIEIFCIKELMIG